MEILSIQNGHPLWEKTIEYASACTWKAGPALAERMKENAFTDRERVIVAVEDDRIAGFCTLSEKDELPADHDFTPFIGFVFVDEQFRGRRLSGKMIDHAVKIAIEAGYGKVYIMSGEIGLYEKYGFSKLGDYETIYGTTEQLFGKTFKNLSELQPSQFYISEKKLHDVETWFDPKAFSTFDPIPIKMLNGIPVMTDGHTRAVAAIRAGLNAVPVIMDEDDLDREMYQECVNASRERNVLSPYDLTGRIITEDDYREKWDKWCDEMQAAVLKKRAK